MVATTSSGSGDCREICMTANAPINIPAPNGCASTCGSGETCAYTYSYPTTDLTVTNRGEYLEISQNAASTTASVATFAGESRAR